MFQVVLLPEVHDAILSHARWILRESGSSSAAKRWMDGIYAAADGLETEPRSHPLALEDEHHDLEIRKRVIGGFTLLFTVVDLERQVLVISARGQGQLPQI